MKLAVPIALSALLLTPLATAQDETSAPLPWSDFEQKGLDWLLRLQRDGVFGMPGRGGQMRPDAGITSICLTALAAKPAKERSKSENEALEKGIRWLLSQQREDGSFSQRTPNYVTCAAVMAIHASGVSGAEAALAKAQRYLVAMQNAEKGGLSPEDRDYGSYGYGGQRGGRGDLSNTQFAIEALRLTGLKSDDEVFAKALVFLRKCQNLPGKGSFRGPHGGQGEAKKVVRAGEDGGATYYPGTTVVGYDETSDGEMIPRSYGSMTYALLKCYILAGLPKEDPRLKAALSWAGKNFTVDENPGAKPGLEEKVKYQGLYYYYLTMARAYHFGGIDKVGKKDWRQRLRQKLIEEQEDDGSWVNEKNGRWYEQSPIICTAYALIALRQ